MGAQRGRNQDAPQLFRRVSEFGTIAHVHRITLQTLHRLGNIHAAHSGHDDVLDIADGEAIARRFLPFDLEVEEIAAGNPL